MLSVAAVAACGSVEAEPDGGTTPDANTGPITIASGQGAPAGIAVSATGIYFANRDDGTIAHCPLEGCGDNPPDILASGQDAPISVAAGDTDLYWVTGWRAGDSGMPASRPVFHCPIANCTPATTAEFDRGDNQPYGIRVVSGTVYLAGWPKMATCPTSGCTNATTDIGLGPSLDINFDADSYYDALYGWSQLQRCTRPDCSDAVAWIDDVYPTAVAVDDTTVYTTDYDYTGQANMPGRAPRILACPRTGCDTTTMTVIAEGDVSPYGLAQYGDRLYYTNLEQGTVIRIPKP